MEIPDLEFADTCARLQSLLKGLGTATDEIALHAARVIALSGQLEGVDLFISLRWLASERALVATNVGYRDRFAARKTRSKSLRLIQELVPPNFAGADRRAWNNDLALFLKRNRVLLRPTIAAISRMGATTRLEPRKYFSDLTDALRPTPGGRAALERIDGAVWIDWFESRPQSQFKSGVLAELLANHDDPTPDDIDSIRIVNRELRPRMKDVSSAIDLLSAKRAVRLGKRLTGLYGPYIPQMFASFMEGEDLEIALAALPNLHADIVMVAEPSERWNSERIERADEQLREQLDRMDVTTRPVAVLHGTGWRMSGRVFARSIELSLRMDQLALALAKLPFPLSDSLDDASQSGHAANAKSQGLEVTLPAQLDSGLKFRSGPSGALKLDLEPPEDSYERIRATLQRKTARLLADIQPSSPHYNHLARFAPDLAFYQSALEQHDDAAFEIWSYGNTLRRLHIHDQRQAAMPDGWRDGIPTEFSERLADLIDTHNTAIASHSGLLNLERTKSTSPYAPPQTIQAAAAEVIAEVMSSAPQAIEPRAARALLRAVAAAQLPSTPETKMSDSLREIESRAGMDSMGNALLALTKIIQTNAMSLELQQAQFLATRQVANSTADIADLLKPGPKRNAWVQRLKEKLLDASAGAGAAVVATTAVIVLIQPILAFVQANPYLSVVTNALESLFRYLNIPLGNI